MIKKDEKDRMFKRFMLKSVLDKIKEIDSKIKFNKNHINRISIENSLLKKLRAEFHRYRKQIEEKGDKE